MTTRAPTPRVRDLAEAAVVVTTADLARGGDLPPELAPRAAPRRASRNEAQIMLDSRVAELHAKWHEEGCDPTWLRQPQGYYEVEPAKVQSIKDMIRKSGRLLRCPHNRGQLTIRFGRDGLTNPEGSIIVAFTVVDKSSAHQED